MGHRFNDENFPNILKLADGLKAIADKHSATAGQVAIAWLLAQGQDIIPIPGTKRVKVCRAQIVKRRAVTDACSVPARESRGPGGTPDSRGSF